QLWLLGSAVYRGRGVERQAGSEIMDDPASFGGADALSRLRVLRQAIARPATDCGRASASVRLVAVSKTFSADEVWPTIAEGDQVLFGENRVQEAKAKWPLLGERAAALGKTIDLHLIGPLQSNKAREAVELFDAI